VVLDSVFQHLCAARVIIEGLIPEPNMVIPGKKSPDQGDTLSHCEQHSHAEVASTGGCSWRLQFLSGGRSYGCDFCTWVSWHAAGPCPGADVSYGRRRLQGDALIAWAGKASVCGVDSRHWRRAPAQWLGAAGGIQTLDGIPALAIPQTPLACSPLLRLMRSKPTIESARPQEKKR